MKRAKGILLPSIRIILLGILIALLLPMTVLTEETGIRLEIDGQTLYNLPAPPIIQDGHTLVPARAVFESMGADVKWHGDTRTVHIQHQNRYIVVTIDRTDIAVNGQISEMPIQAQIINEHTMIPLRAVAENLGFDVDFRDRTVFVDSPLTLTSYAEHYLPLMPDTDVESSIVSSYAPTITRPVTPPRDVSLTEILSMDFPATIINSISMPTEFNEQTFTIIASSPISSVEKVLLGDNRLVLDIPNSRTELLGAFPLPSFSSVAGIRALQFTNSISRVVFDLPNDIRPVPKPCKTLQNLL